MPAPEGRLKNLTAADGRFCVTNGVNEFLPVLLLKSMAIRLLPTTTFDTRMTQLKTGFNRYYQGKLKQFQRLHPDVKRQSWAY